MNRSQLSGLIFCCGILIFSALNANAQPVGKCEPIIETSSLLNNVDVSGALRLGPLVARCLPMPEKKSKTAYQYNPYDGGKFSAVLKDSKGQTLNTLVWYGRSVLTIWELDRYEVVGGGQALKDLSSGNYLLEFAIEDKPFQRFPFSVTTRESSDQFRPETLYYTDGLWRTYAHLYAPNVDRFFQLGVWLRLEDSVTDPKQAPVPYSLKLIRESDKKLIAENAEGSLKLNTKWHNFNLSFRRPNAAQTKDYSEFKLSEVLAADGKYRIELKLDGRPTAIYILTIKNGQINGLDPIEVRKEKFRVIIPLTREK